MAKTDFSTVSDHPLMRVRFKVRIDTMEIVMETGGGNLVLSGDQAVIVAGRLLRAVESLNEISAPRERAKAAS